MITRSGCLRSAHRLKNADPQCGTAGWLFGLWLTLAIFASCVASDGAQRLVAWGDMRYELPASLADENSALLQISCGSFHSLTLANGGWVKSWGDNRFNQTNIPDVLKTKPAMSIAAGNVHNIALLTSGNVIAWGPLPGQYGNYGQCTVPTGLGQIAKIAAGAVHNLALRTDGTVAAWGDNQYGQCNVPPGLDSVVAIAGGMYHSLALRKDGTVVAWGDRKYGQTAVPPSLTNVVSIAAGGYHNLVLTSDGTVVSWGKYGLAVCDVPLGISNVVAVATGDLHSLALKSDGTVVTWGFDTAGQCSIPAGLSNVVAIAARGSHSMALVQEFSPDGPELRIEVSQTAILVSWQASAVPAILEQTAHLELAGKWIPVQNMPKEVGGRYVVSFPPENAMFFRLVRP